MTRFANRAHDSVVAEEIVANFESRKFLPERRDAQRFFDRLGMPRQLKSRAAALEPLVDVLSQMSSSDLAELLEVAASPRSDDYLLLARRIMKGSGT